jgi:hypothetical protein
MTHKLGCYISDFAMPSSKDYSHLPEASWISLHPCNAHILHVVTLLHFCYYFCPNRLQCSHRMKSNTSWLSTEMKLVSLLQTQRMQYVPTITNHTQVWWVPNAIVAHEKEGIEAVHLASGRTICKVYRIYPCNLFYFNSMQPYSISPLTCFSFWNYSHFQLHLTEGGLHADINGDGVLDHVQVG